MYKVGAPERSPSPPKSIPFQRGSLGGQLTKSSRSLGMAPSLLMMELTGRVQMPVSRFGVAMVSGSMFQALLIRSICSRVRLAGQAGWYLYPALKYHENQKFWIAPPRKKFPISLYGPTFPMPAPELIGTAAARPGCCAAFILCCSSALDEHPMVPTLAFDQGCLVTQSIVS